MILVFGGAYNGKIKYIKEKYNIDKDDIYFCNNSELNFDKKVICGLHVFVKYCTDENIESLEILKNNIHNLKDKIIITDEIGSGIVPMTKEDRKWREETGRCIQYLCKNSTEVYRIFFGIEETLKKEI